MNGSLKFQKINSKFQLLCSKKLEKTYVKKEFNYNFNCSLWTISTI